MSSDAKRAANRKWYAGNRDQVRIIRRRYATKRREKVILAYGGKCVCCGFSDITVKLHGRRFLQIDHINGSGGKHVRDLRILGSAFYDWLRKNDYPKEFRVLCASCNVAMKPGEIVCELHKWEKANGNWV